MKNFKALALIILNLVTILPHFAQADSIQPILPNSPALKWSDAAELVFR
ncbi:MAG: hypothetical protein KIT56_08245 [Gammaproteobacteria bacterium]|nr:hypothetical protein [Gammaproteobacteria bacterium]MCW5583849.1 hypothetical protein [Gammaproteobacteria bacterium]